MPYPLLLVSTTLWLIVFISGLLAYRVWKQRQVRVREPYAMWMIIAVGAAMLQIGLAWRSLMPWQIPAEWWRILMSREAEASAPRIIDYVLVGFIWLIVYRHTRHVYERWNGLRSLQHQRRTERGEPAQLTLDGFRELLRVLTWGSKSPVYVPSAVDGTTQVLDTVHDSLSWRDEARELLRLSSAAYTIESDAWHDSQLCWVGSNRDTGDPVFLFPMHEPPDRHDLRRMITHVQRLAKDRPFSQLELIIALEDERPIEPGIIDSAFRVVTRAELLDGIVNFTDYRRAIIQRVEANALPDSALTLRDVYVPGRLISRDGGEIGDAEAYLTDWLEDHSRRQIAMLGGYGQGKSTTALMFTYKLLTAHDWKRQRVPVLVELRGTSPRNLTPLQLLGAWAAQYNINPQGLFLLHKAGRILMIFEGFDEMALIGDADMRLKHFKVLWQFCYERAKILITGRPNFFLDDEEMRTALGIHAPVSGRPYCDAVRLAPFTPEQIESSLRAHPDSVRIGVTELVARNSRFADLVARPSLLHIVAVLWDRERLYEKADDLDSAYVMELFVRHSYRRQGLKESDSRDFMALTTSEREYFMQAIAAYMAGHRLPNQIHITALNQLIEDLVEAAPLAISQNPSAMTGEVAQPLRDRVAAREHGIEHVKTDVRACGLLVDDPAASGTFRFGHKSFMEYLFAATVAIRIVDDSAESRNVLRIAGARIGEIVQLPVAIQFLSEILDRGGSGRTSSRGDRVQQKAAAAQLLRAVLDRSGSLSWFGRYVLFQWAYDCSLRHKPFAVRLLATFANPSALTAAGAVLVIQLTTWRLLHQGNAKNALPLTFDFVLMLMLMSTLLSTTALLRHRPVKAELSLWNLLCIRLGIDDIVLHRFAGTYWLPWARTRPFDYFVAPDDSRLPQADGSIVKGQSP